MVAPSPRPTVARRFTLLDAMILVGSAALGLAVTRWFDPKADWWALIKAVAANFAWELDLFDEFMGGLLVFAVPPAVTLTSGVLALRLRPPRLRWRKLARQPGLVACLALLLGWAAGMAFTVVNVLSIDRMSLMPKTGVAYAQEPLTWLRTFSDWGSLLGGFAVVVAWATQAFVGRWRAEPTWIDRLGRLVGLAWIAMALAACFVIRSTSG